MGTRVRPLHYIMNAEHWTAAITPARDLVHTVAGHKIHSNLLVREAMDYSESFQYSSGRRHITETSRTGQDRIERENIRFSRLYYSVQKTLASQQASKGRVGVL